MQTHLILHSFNPGAKFIILYINPNVLLTNATQINQAYDMFRLMYDRYNAANVVFLHTINGNDYRIFVTNPYQNQTNCGKWCSKIINIFMAIDFIYYESQVHCNQFYWIVV